MIISKTGHLFKAKILCTGQNFSHKNYLCESDLVWVDVAVGFLNEACGMQ
jgi:hypothetical protein